MWSILTTSEFKTLLHITSTNKLLSSGCLYDASTKIANILVVIFGPLIVSRENVDYKYLTLSFKYIFLDFIKVYCAGVFLHNVNGFLMSNLILEGGSVLLLCFFNFLHYFLFLLNISQCYSVYTYQITDLISLLKKQPTCIDKKSYSTRRYLKTKPHEEVCKFFVS